MAHIAARWTNPSVRAMAEDRDPVEVITLRARQLVLQALDEGWTGPPFDPITLAEFLRLDVAANSEVRDARTVPLGRGKVRIEFNPNRPRGRMRYSVAHEIAHTLFPDCAERIRNRTQHRDLEGDDWQLEALCNIAAAEFLMPVASFAPLAAESLSIQSVLDLQREFDVSTEALVIRLAETSELSLAAFCASPRDPSQLSGYQLDYMIPSRGWGAQRIPRRVHLPQDSVVRQCTAIGYSAHGVENWWSKSGPTRVDAVGIPSYPGGIAPRVVGFLRPIAGAPASLPAIKYVHGSATESRGDGPNLVVQVVNDKTANWGGGGFAGAVRKAWPSVQDDFRDWSVHSHASFRLGGVRVSRVNERLSVASVIAQHGYGPSSTPRLRYSALREGLAKVAQLALVSGASVHMPRIGTGQAGGSWSIVRELIGETLGEAGIRVTVYDLPGSRHPIDAQTSLSLGVASAADGPD